MAYALKRVLSGVLMVLLGLSGCIIVANCGGNTGKEKFSKTVEIAAPMAEGAPLRIDSTNGSITIKGAETAEAFMTVTIEGRAATIERAQELAEQTEVLLESYNGGLRTVTNTPKKNRAESVSVSFNATVPMSASLEANTTNGNIEFASVSGDMRADTTNGNVKMTKIAAARLNADTTNGSITLEQVSAESVTVDTTNGSIRAVIAPVEGANFNVRMNTTNGSITLELPAEVSAKIEASTVNGKIDSNRHFTSVERKAKDSLRGTLGTGRGRIELKTTNGSIHVR
jgi:DUF4097 and DUF4098 domain-containing protein YvlB